MSRAAVRVAANSYGPTYLRFTRDALPIIYDKDIDFKIGRSIKLIEGEDVTIISIGDMTHIALEAHEALVKEKIKARILDMPTLKPIDRQAIIDAAQQTGAIITVEDHQISGGLGSAVAEVVVEECPVPMERIALPDTFARSGEYRLLLERYGMAPRHIVGAVKKVIKRKGK